MKKYILSNSVIVLLYCLSTSCFGDQVSSSIKKDLNFENASYCKTKSNTFYDYDYRFKVKHDLSNIISAKFLYYKVNDKVSSPSLFYKSHHNIVGSNKLDSICMDKLDLQNKSYLFYASSIDNYKSMFFLGCSKDSLYSFSNDMSSISCFNKANNKFGEIAFKGDIFSKSSNYKTVKTARCKGGRFFKIGTQYINDTWAEDIKDNFKWSAWLCVNGDAIKRMDVKQQVVFTKKLKNIDTKKSSKFYLSCFDKGWYKYRWGDRYHSDDISQVGHRTNMCVLPSEKINKVEVGCPTGREKAHEGNWNGIGCNNGMSDIYVSEIGAIKLAKPIGYDELKCLDGGQWKQLDKGLYKNKKVNGYMKNGLIWQKWGCIKNAGDLLSKVRRIL